MSQTEFEANTKKYDNILFRLNLSCCSVLLINALDQGFQTQLCWRAAFHQENALRNLRLLEKGFCGLQFTREAIKNFSCLRAAQMHQAGRVFETSGVNFTNILLTQLCQYSCAKKV